MYPIGILFIAYILVTRMTDAYFMGDTWIYVNDVLKAETLGATFWDFGHPLWRSIAWIFARMSYPLTRVLFGEDRWLNVTFALLAINWLTGLISVVLVYLLAARLSTRRWVPYLLATAFLTSNVILNYSQTAQPYVPGIALMFLALYLLVRTDGPVRKRTTLSAGVILAVGVCQWLPLALSVPAIVLAPIFLFGFDKVRLRGAMETSLACGLTLVLVFTSMAVHLGINDLASLKVWVGSSAHGVLPDAPLKAILRMLFALARNLINMGNDGRLFKRYVVHDPFNPVSFSELFRLSLWKLVLFYVFLASVVINLVLFRLGRKALVLLLLNAVPTLLFAVFLFESGSIDRYLPVFPLLFLALAVSLGSESSRSWATLIGVVFIAVAAFSNLNAMSSASLNHEREKVAARIRYVQPLLKPGSRLVTANQQDEVYAFNQNFPFDPLNRSGNFGADMLVDPGTTQIERWKQIFASKTLSSWESGGDVWITARVFSQRPQAEWNWVERDDPRISWKDLHEFFSEIEMGQSSGGEDGFVLVSPSDRNKQWLSEVARERGSLKVREN